MGRVLLQPQGWPVWLEDRCHGSLVLGPWMGCLIQPPNCEGADQNLPAFMWGRSQLADS